MKANKKYMVVQIGCIECGVSSYPIGIYNTLEDAEKVYRSWDGEGGHGYVEIWVINEDNTTGIII